MQFTPVRGSSKSPSIIRHKLHNRTSADEPLPLCCQHESHASRFSPPHHGTASKKMNVTLTLTPAKEEGGDSSRSVSYLRSQFHMQGIHRVLNMAL